MNGIQAAAVEKVTGLGRASLTEYEGKQLIAEWGIPVTKEEVAGSAAEAREAAQRIGYPVALKVNSPDILHKTEAGGIRLGLKDGAEVSAAFDEIMEGRGGTTPRPGSRECWSRRWSAGAWKSSPE